MRALLDRDREHVGVGLRFRPESFEVGAGETVEHFPYRIAGTRDVPFALRARLIAAFSALARNHHLAARISRVLLEGPVHPRKRNRLAEPSDERHRPIDARSDGPRAGLARDVALERDERAGAV